MKCGDPQIEDGYTRFANELLEAFIKKCKGPEAIFLAVGRQTYGFGGRLSAAISNKTMCELTGIRISHINRAINSAVEKGYINITKNGDKSHPVYSINKKYLNWKISPKMVISPKLVKTITKTGDAPYKEKNKETSAFLMFWNIYPKKRAKKSALKAWEKLNMDNGLLEKIINAVKTQSGSDDWIKDKGQFIPYPASWLNGHRWEDETTLINEPKRRRF